MVGCAIRRSEVDEVLCSKATADNSSSISSRVLVDVVLGILTFCVVTLSFRYWRISGEIAYSSRWVSVTELSRLLSMTCWTTSSSSMLDRHRVWVEDE